MAHNPFRHDEQPGLEVAPATAPQVVYDQGLEYDQNPPVTAQNNYQGQYPAAVPYNVYQQSTYHPTTTSAWSPGSTNAYTVEGPPSPEKIPRDNRILGMPRKRFWLILAALLITVFAIALGLGVGLGLGLSTNNTSR